MATLEEVERRGLPFWDDMCGHAGLSPFMQRGFDIITLA